jgi:Acetyltransferase (GNAT) family
MTDRAPLCLECVSADDLAGDGDWWQIYDSSFPDDEREPRAVILGSLRAGTGLAVRTRQGDQVVGLATVHLLYQPAAVFLVYLAVAAEQRGRKIGGEVLEYAWEAGTRRLAEQGRTATGLVWEVDRPDLAPTSQDEVIRERRIAFFQRQGGTLLSRPYVQPALRAGRPVPMHLMVRPAPGNPVPGPETTEALVRAIYHEKYGRANGIPEALLAELLRG